VNNKKNNMENKTCSRCRKIKLIDEYSKVILFVNNVKEKTTTITHKEK